MIQVTDLLPLGKRWRQLWLPEALNASASLPGAVEGSYGLTLTGARGGTTTDGVYFNRSATGHIDCGAIHDNATKLWISFRIKRDRNNDMYFTGKKLDGNNILQIYNIGTTIHFQHFNGGVNLFDITVALGTFELNTWYHILASISSVNGARLRVNGGTAATNADTTALFAGGNWYIGDREVGSGASTGGVIADFIMGTDDLSTNEELDLYQGAIPLDAVNFWPLDEGRGVTAYDRGSGGNNGTLNTGASWAYGGVKLPIISFDSINDRARSAAGINIQRPCTMVWVGKMKQVYPSVISRSATLFDLSVDGNNRLILSHDAGFAYAVFVGIGGGVAPEARFTPAPTIDDYWVFVGTMSAAGVVTAYINGVSVASNSNASLAPVGAAYATLGQNYLNTNGDNSKCIMAGLVDGALTAAEVRTLSRYLDQKLGLGLRIQQ